jgi:Flp pilus assembly protein TadG
VDGAALVEATLVLPLLLFIVLATVMAGLAIRQYYLISNLAYEMARYGATLSGLPEGKKELRGDASGKIHPTHRLLLYRLVRLFDRGGLDRSWNAGGTPGNQVILTVELTPEMNTAPGTPLSRQEVRISLSAPLGTTSYLPGQSWLRIRSRAEAPFLYPPKLVDP